MHTQNTDSHTWSSTRLNSNALFLLCSRTSCVVYRWYGRWQQAFSSVKSFTLYIQTRQMKLAELLRLWGYCQIFMWAPMPRTPYAFQLSSWQGQALIQDTLQFLTATCGATTMTGIFCSHSKWHYCTGELKTNHCLPCLPIHLHCNHTHLHDKTPSNTYSPEPHTASLNLLLE